MFGLRPPSLAPAGGWAGQVWPFKEEREAPPQWHLPALASRGRSSFPGCTAAVATSPGDSPRPAGRSGPSTYQMTAFVLGRVAFGVHFPQTPGLLKSSSASLQSLMPWGLVFLVLGSPMGSELIPVGNRCRSGECPVLGLAGVLRRDHQVRVLGFVHERSQERARGKQKPVYLEGCMLQRQNSDWLRKREWPRSAGALFFRNCVTSYAKRVGGIFLFFQGKVEISQDSGHCSLFDLSWFLSELLWHKGE